MESKTIIELYKDIVVQIATPYSTGTGFYVKKYNLIITNEHVVHDNKQVIIKANGKEKRIVDVIYIDKKYDLAFLEIPKSYNFPEITTSEEMNLVEGDGVIAVGHPFGLKYSATKGIISNVRHKENNIEYLQHDAALNPGNSGGPLIDENGVVVGVNTFIIKNGNSIGFSLPAHYVSSTMDSFLEGNHKHGTRCESCLNIVFEKKNEDRYCPHCGYKLELISDIDDYEPFGINKLLEKVLGELGVDVSLSRRGPNFWEIKEGETMLNIQFVEEYNFIIANALLGALPKENIKKIYEFLLGENEKIDDLVLSINNQYIFLSLKIMSQDLKEENAKISIQNIKEKLRYYSNILIGEFNAEIVDIT